MEISGVPEQSNENCIKLVENIYKVVDGMTNVESVYCLRSNQSNKYGKIVAVLLSKEEKLKWI